MKTMRISALALAIVIMWGSAVALAEEKPARAVINPEIVQTAPAHKGPAPWAQLYGNQKWYASQKGKLQTFTGTLQAIPQKPGIGSTLMRTAHYRLGKWRIFTSGQRHHALDRLVGKRVSIRGKAVEMNLEGHHLREIWPASVRQEPEAGNNKPQFVPGREPMPGKGKALPVAMGGISVTITPTKKAFGPKDTIAFLVTYKNVGERGFMLCDPGFAPAYRTTFVNVKTKQEYMAVCTAKYERGFTSIALEAGKSVQYTAKFPRNHYAYIVRQPLPPVKNRPMTPALHPVEKATAKSLPPGVYRAIIRINLRRHPRAATMDTRFAWWQGALSPTPVEFTVKGE
jgi:hypothetical protein